MVSFVADYGLFPCQAGTILMRATNVEFTTNSAIEITTCYSHVLCFQSLYQLFILYLFPKILL